MRLVFFATLVLLLSVSADAWGRRRRRRCKPNNCRLSSWTPWSGCNKICGFGIQRRERHVTAPARCGGSRCPSNLAETRSCNSQSCDGVKRSKQLRHAAITWAPLIYLHKKEKFMPSSIDFFLRHVVMTEGNRRICRKPVLTSRNLCHASTNAFLVTKGRLRSPSATNLRVLFGKRGDNVKAYAVVKDLKERKYVDIYYWFFFPYNRGKRVCIGTKIPRIGCVGGYSTFGHHVGDWEHVSVRFSKNLDPLQAYAGAHSFGTRFYYHHSSGTFRDGKKLVQMSGSHPVFYSAKGSHGMWHRPGRFVYKKIAWGIVDKLVDYTNAGQPWRTWKNLQIIWWGQWGGEANFMKYAGRWGNKKRGRCVGSICILGNGPTGPLFKKVMSSNVLV